MIRIDISWVNCWMLYQKRRYVIDEIKTPLMRAMICFGKGASWLSMLIALIQMVRIARRYPEPTEKHTREPNTHTLIDIQNKFFKNEDNAGRDALFRAMWRMFIIEYEHDPYYRDRLDWIVRELVGAVKNGKWKSGRRPKKCWNEQ